MAPTPMTESESRSGLERRGVGRQDADQIRSTRATTGAHLDLRREVAVHVVDLVLEALPPPSRQPPKPATILDADKLQRRRLAWLSISSASSRMRVLMLRVRRLRRRIMSKTRPGVPDTMCCP